MAKEANVITWAFDEGTFRPAAKLVGDKAYSIITDYLGTPAEMYDAEGIKIWQAEFDIYGRARKETEESINFVPFLYQGQYFDSETGLYYDRFRYYDPKTGNCISQDPIGLARNNPTLYGCVNAPNTRIAPLGLSEGSGSLGRNLSKAGMEHGMNPFNVRDFQARHAIPHEVWVDGQQFF